MTEAISQEEKAGKVQDLFSVEGMTTALAAQLADHDITTRDDLADLAVDELMEMSTLKEADAKAIIIKAREHWFAE